MEDEPNEEAPKVKREKRCSNKVCHIHKTVGKTAHDRAKGKDKARADNKQKRAEQNRNQSSGKKS